MATLSYIYMYLRNLLASLLCEAARIYTTTERVCVCICDDDGVTFQAADLASRERDNALATSFAACAACCRWILSESAHAYSQRRFNTLLSSLSLGERAETMCATLKYTQRFMIGEEGGRAGLNCRTHRSIILLEWPNFNDALVAPTLIVSCLI